MSTIDPNDVTVDHMRSPAVSGGFRTGDWLVRVNGQEHRVYASVPAQIPMADMTRRVQETAARKIGKPEFRFADWNPQRGTVPAYYVGEGDLIEPGEALIVDGAPCSMGGEPLADDNSTCRLTGWIHAECASYNDGRVLIPLRASLQP